MGRIGFVVAPGDGMTPLHQLGPTGSAFIIDFVGFGGLLLTNSNGEKIGFTEGKYIDQIFNAQRVDDPNDDTDYLSERPPDSSPLTKSERRYYFSQDTALTAEVSGIADGTYDFVKTKGDGMVTFSDVPTADGVKDIISVTDHKFSIKFGIGSRRNGKFYLIVKNDDPLKMIGNADRLLYRGTRFEASHLSVIPGATFSYRIDWEALRVGENGVRIEVDENSDGNIDFTGTVGAKLDDAVAPTTTPDLSGTQLSTGS